MASAPARAACTASSGRVMPQILTRGVLIEILSGNAGRRTAPQAAPPAPRGPSMLAKRRGSGTRTCHSILPDHEAAAGVGLPANSGPPASAHSLAGKPPQWLRPLFNLLQPERPQRLPRQFKLIRVTDIHQIQS